MIEHGKADKVGRRRIGRRNGQPRPFPCGPIRLTQAGKPVGRLLFIAGRRDRAARQKQREQETEEAAGR
jgi:hypothetical protein